MFEFTRTLGSASFIYTNTRIFNIENTLDPYFILSLLFTCENIGTLCRIAHPLLVSFEVTQGQLNETIDLYAMVEVVDVFDLDPVGSISKLLGSGMFSSYAGAA